MKQKYIENIRQACIASNPSILDLKFGCEVPTSNKNHKDFFVGRNEVEDEDYFIAIDQVGCEDVHIS